MQSTWYLLVPKYQHMYFWREFYSNRYISYRLFSRCTTSVLDIRLYYVANFIRQVCVQRSTGSGKLYKVTMSKTHSPTVFNGEADNFYESNFTLDLNKRMRVPKTIRVSGDYTDEDVVATNGSARNQVFAETYEMHVPERILVVGQDHHIGTKALPREITLENAILPPEQNSVRVQRCARTRKCWVRTGQEFYSELGRTPPRILTLDNHYFPAVDEEEQTPYVPEVKNTVSPKPRVPYSTETEIVRHVREQTPSYSALNVSIPPSEEVQHLRRQVGKLNRRVMAIELDMVQRQQRDKILYALTLTYLILKAFSWLTRN